MLPIQSGSVFPFQPNPTTLWPVEKKGADVPGASGERFEPVSPEHFPSLGKLQRHSELSGFQIGTEWKKGLEKQGLEICSPMLYGSVGMALHLCSQGGKIKADLRPAGDAQEGIPLAPVPADYDSQSKFKLPDGGVVSVYQSPVGGFDDLRVGVKQADNFDAAVSFKDGHSDEVSATQGADTVELRDKGQEVFLFHSNGQHLVRGSDRYGTDALQNRPPAFTMRNEFGSPWTSPPFSIQNATAPTFDTVRATGDDMQSLVASSKGLIARLEDQFPSLTLTEFDPASNVVEHELSLPPTAWSRWSGEESLSGAVSEGGISDNYQVLQALIDAKSRTTT